MLELYHTPGSSCCVKVRFLLNEKELDYREHLIDLRRGDQLTPEFRELNPKAEVPVLVHDGFALPESTVIMEYLEDIYPNPERRPKDPASRARMRLWTKWPDEGGHTAYSSLAFALAHRYRAHDRTPGWVENQLRQKPDEARQRRQKSAIEKGVDNSALCETMRKFDQVIRKMNTTLKQTSWLAGDMFTLADIAMIPYIVRLDVMTLLDIWKADCPRVFDWLTQVQSRPAYAKTYERLEGSESHILMRKHGKLAFQHLRSLLTDELEKMNATQV